MVLAMHDYMGEVVTVGARLRHYDGFRTATDGIADGGKKTVNE
jgi:hypothetical protein